ncbi:MAG: hypothetical protein HZB84_06015 [Deltaproteobacteria bacterium]|nr:hypothetical protein [Deltaproteobacteria bacterium]
MGTTVTIENITAIISLGLAFVVLWVYYFWFYRQYRVDKTRQDLFFLRNELFDYAAEGNISFDHPAYSLLRNTMNSIIRFTHRIDLVTLFCIYVSTKFSPPPSNNFTIAFKNNLNAIPSNKVREDIEKFHIRMNIIVATHLIKSSIPLMLLTIFLVVVILIRQGWGILKYEIMKYEIRKQFPGINQIDNIAAELG